MAIFVSLLSAQPCPADETLTLQGASPMLILDDNVGDFAYERGKWYFAGAGEGMGISWTQDGVNFEMPFVIRAGALTNKLVIQPSGIGLGAESPKKQLHIKNSTPNPTIRLESTYAPAPSHWDLVGSGPYFSICNAKYEGMEGYPILFPFNISTDALTNTLNLAAGGKVGIGTGTPDENSRVDIRSDSNNGLLAKRSSANAHYLRVENSNSVFRCGVQSTGDAQFGALTAGKGLNMLAGGATKMLVNSSGQISFGNAPVAITTHALVHQTGARLTDVGVWANASSRDLKQDIEPITSEQARDTVRALQPVGYRYKSNPEEHYVGFIAEDVPDLVALQDRKSLASMDVVGVLTKVVQDQDQLLAAQQTKLDAQQLKLEKLEKQEALIAALTERLEALERANAVASQPE